MRRHALDATARTVEEAVAAVVCLHATEPATVYLSAAVRSGVGRAEVDRALFEDRSVHKQLAMRRTLFAFPLDLLPAAWASASARVAGQQERRLPKDLVLSGVCGDEDAARAWVRRVGEEVLTSLRLQGPATTSQLRARVPELDRRLGDTSGASAPVAGRLLVLLGARAHVVRGPNLLGWRAARQEWCLPEQWLGQVPAPPPEAEGYRELVRRWLGRFGPGTEADLVWWLGATKAAVRRALAELAAVEVLLDSGEAGWVLPGDLEPTEARAPCAALLPVLDPTTMGWRGREFYLGGVEAAQAAHHFDVNGNAGPTAWWDGQVVGGWVQDAAGVVRVVMTRDVGAEAVAALEERAAWLTGWLGGEVVSTVYPSPMMRRERLA